MIRMKMVKYIETENTKHKQPTPLLIIFQQIDNTTKQKQKIASQRFKPLFVSLYSRLERERVYDMTGKSWLSFFEK